ncbi:hypothetical protein K501DRAFT_280204 [Backusella circina FSU 941]|nr:hypothetical protein K501DRAFT_280204 [Backusella circina FSU 941]
MLSYFYNSSNLPFDQNSEQKASFLGHVSVIQEEMSKLEKIIVENFEDDYSRPRSKKRKEIIQRRLIDYSKRYAEESMGLQQIFCRGFKKWLTRNTSPVTPVETGASEPLSLDNDSNKTSNTTGGSHKELVSLVDENEKRIMMEMKIIKNQCLNNILNHRDRDSSEIGSVPPNVRWAPNTAVSVQIQFL